MAEIRMTTKELERQKEALKDVPMFDGGGIKEISRETQTGVTPTFVLDITSRKELENAWEGAVSILQWLQETLEDHQGLTNVHKQVISGNIAYYGRLVIGLEYILGIPEETVNTRKRMAIQDFLQKPGLSEEDVEQSNDASLLNPDIIKDGLDEDKQIYLKSFPYEVDVTDIESLLYARSDLMRIERSLNEFFNNLYEYDEEPYQEIVDQRDACTRTIKGLEQILGVEEMSDGEVEEKAKKFFEDTGMTDDKVDELRENKEQPQEYKVSSNVHANSYVLEEVSNKFLTKDERYDVAEEVQEQENKKGSLSVEEFIEKVWERASKKGYSRSNFVQTVVDAYKEFNETLKENELEDVGDKINKEYIYNEPSNPNSGRYNYILPRGHSQEKFDYYEKQGEVKEGSTQEVDMVNSPPHYTQGKYETIEKMEMKYGTRALAIYCLLTTEKYESRAGLKETEYPEQDYDKADWYYERMMKLQQKIGTKEEIMGVPGLLDSYL